jgi:hypothetical protein
MEVIKSTQNVISIGGTCIADINGRFFLLVEIEIVASGVDIQEVLAFRLTPEEAQALIAADIQICRIVNEIPEPGPEQEVEFKCVLIVGSQAFLVFEIENSTEELVLVRSEICPIIG